MSIDPGFKDKIARWIITNCITEIAGGVESSMCYLNIFLRSFERKLNFVTKTVPEEYLGLWQTSVMELYLETVSS